MSLSVVFSRASFGINAPLVTIEVHLSAGMPAFNMVGLPEKAVKESKERVRSAIYNANFDFPMRRMTVNLAPADLPKEGGRFDLPIALGVLAASGQLPADLLKEFEFVGELALSGELRQVRGVLPFVIAAHKAGRGAIVPSANTHEAGIFDGGMRFHAPDLLSVCEHLRLERRLPQCESVCIKEQAGFSDLADVKGQPLAKRALEVAAAGRHALLFVGPPGTGKTMLASRLPGILPRLSEQEALESALVASISQPGFDAAKWRQVVLRAPHHSSSPAALVGGGRPPKPGEISLAHHGVLFLDELPEFQRNVLESLREPLESHEITVSRAAFQTTFPADFQFIASMNPCPCGFSGCVDKECQCSLEQIKRYRAKISGPLLDRIDMHVAVARISPDLLQRHDSVAEKSVVVRERVEAARHLQYHRQGKPNAKLTAVELQEVASLNDAANALLAKVMAKFRLSPRVYHRLIKLARTLADLRGENKVGAEAMGEALQFRCLDK